MTKSSSWLDLVFSLLTLNKATKQHLESTLQPEFMDKLLSAGGKDIFECELKSIGSLITNLTYDSQYYKLVLFMLHI